MGEQLLGELGKVMDQDLSHTGELRCMGLVQTLKGIMSLGYFFLHVYEKDTNCSYHSCNTTDEG